MLYEGGRNAELDWAMKKLEGKSFQKFICVLAWFAMIYHFWLDRDAWIYNGEVWIEFVKSYLMQDAIA